MHKSYCFYSNKNLNILFTNLKCVNGTPQYKSHNVPETRCGVHLIIYGQQHCVNLFPPGKSPKYWPWTIVSHSVGNS